MITGAPLTTCAGGGLALGLGLGLGGSSSVLGVKGVIEGDEEVAGVFIVPPAA